MNLLPKTAICAMALMLTQITVAPAQVLPPSPAANSLARFANTPVNLYTGTPNVQAPLFTLPGRRMSVPVGLAYHASGIKLQDVSGPVGLGWALQAGGVITRVVKKMPDDSDVGYSSVLLDPIGEPNATGKYLDQDNPTNYDRNDLLAFSQPHADAEPDLFYFTIPGRSGRFVLDADGKPVLVPYQNIAINFERDEDGKITEWTVVTEDGYRYTFGEDALSRETTQATTRQVDGPDQTVTYTSSWYLSHIEDPGKDERITFAYEAGDEVSVEYYQRTFHDDITNCGDPLANEEYDLSTEVTTKPSKRIARISTTQGYATFSYDFERLDIIDDALTDVRLYNEQDVLEAHYRLDYEHAHSSIGLGAEVRLLLKQVTNKTNGANLVAYRFDYNTTVLPSRNSDRYDHWGYVNDVSPGIDYNTNKYGPPAATVDGETFPGVSRAPYAAAAQGYMLQKITYATGGHTRFEYEGHRAGSSQSVGGVRIHKIYQNDGSGTNPEIVKTYDYHDSGIISSVPQYGYFARVPGEDCKKTLIRYSQSLTNLFDLNGTHIGYGKVSEKLSDGSSTIYHFTNFDEYADDLTPIFRNSSFPELHATNVGYTIPPFAPATSKNWQRGLLETIYYTDQDNQTVKKISYTYNFTTQVRERVRGLVVEEVYDRVFDGFYYFRVAQYEHISQPFFLDYKIEEVYDQGDESNFVATRTDYEYDPNYLQVKKETSTDSEGTEWTTSYRYPTDYIQNLNDRLIRTFADVWTSIDPPEVSGVLGLLLTHQHNQVLETTQRRKRVGESNTQVVAGSLNLFHLADEDDPKSSSRLAQTLTLSLSQPLATTEAFTITPRGDELLNPPIFSPPTPEPYWFSYDTHYETGQTFEAYGDAGNLLQSTARDNVPTSQLYSYRYSLPIAQAVGAAHNQIAYTGFEAPDEATLSLGFLNDREGNFKWNNSDASFHTDAYTGRRSYSGSEIVCENLPSGRYQISCWAKRKPGNNDATVYFGSPGSAQEAGVDWTYLTWTLNSENGVSELPIYSNGNLIDEVRIHPVDAQMTTYTYDPLVGVTSETDANNVTTYYEYDDLNRLRLVKDQHRDIRQRYQYVYKSGE